MTRPCVAARASRAAVGRIGLTYHWRHGRWPDLAQPQRFTEIVQWRKLYDRDARMPALADKVRVKHYVADALGQAWVTPTLWSGGAMPPIFDWQMPCVVKSRHGCNQTIFLHAPPSDYAKVKRHADRWTRRSYGGWLDEWLYAEIPRGVLIEPYVGAPDRLSIDYKFYVFGGRVEAIQVHLGRGGRHRWILFDRNWRRVSAVSDDADPNRPRAFSDMIAAAEILAGDFSFVRVDLYDLDEGPRFGEMTFYPGSGLDPFNPPSLDMRLGRLWRRALAGLPLGVPVLTLPVGPLPATV